MPEPYGGMRDILLGYDTDIYFENGDLMQTTGIDYIEREIYKVLITEPGDWKSDSTVGGSPNIFIGESNTRENARELESHIQQQLTPVVSPAQVEVKAVPTDYNTLMCVIEVKIEGMEILRTPFTFDFVNGFKKLYRRDERTTPIRSSSELKINNITNMRKPNKYWKRLSERS